MRTAPVSTAAVLLVVAGLGCLAPASGATALTCQGLPVTVQGAVGTEGDDVMLAPLDAWVSVKGLGGDDTICLVDGKGGTRDPMFFADAGPGDDLVAYQASYSGSVILGAGADRFVGTDVGAYVYTGASAPIPGGVGYFGQTDTEADVVLAGAGRDSVYSGDTTGYAPNPDRIATGDSTADADTVFYAGRMTPDGDLDNGASRDLLFLVGSWAPGELVIDNGDGRERADLAGTAVLRWTAVRDFVLDERPAAVRFVGSAESDRLTVGDNQLLTAPGDPMTVDVSTGSGRDRVSLAGAIRGSVDLGVGERDSLSLGGACERTRLRLGADLACSLGAEQWRTGLSGVEEAFVRGDRVTAIGTTGRDWITVSSSEARVRGRSGRDVLSVGHKNATIDGGAGRDQCSGGIQRRCETRH